MKIGYCFTGSFCTFSRSLDALRAIVHMGHEVHPIMSENAYYTDTRFQLSEEFSREVERLCGRTVIHTVVDAEPLGPSQPLDLLIVAPCTGNTLAKIASGITDTSATMAVKAHLRADRPLIIALASNDAMSQNLSNISTLLARKSVLLVPMRQDSPKGKPHSLVAEFELIPGLVSRFAEGDISVDELQPRPIFV